MATTFDITGRINAAVSSGSLRMLKKLQTELRATAKALLKMGETSTANALGHTAMALDRVAGATGKVADSAKKVVESTAKTTKAMAKAATVAEKSQGIYKQVAEGYKLNALEAGALYKAIGKLGDKYNYSANRQKEWVPALKTSLAEIYKQKAALVASGRAITTHISSQELFARTNQNLASGLHKISGKLTDYDEAMKRSLGRSPAFRGAVDKIAGAVGKQGESFKSQFAALTKVDNVWRDHVTTMHRAGKVTAKQAQGMYDSYAHLGVGAKELQARIKASNGELLNAATYNKAAREELTQHTKSMAVLSKAEEKLAAVTGKSANTIQKETEALMKRTGSLDAAVVGIDKQTKAYKSMSKSQAEVVKKEQSLAKVTGAQIGKIQEITTRMRAQGVSYANISKHLDTLKTRHSATAAQMGKVSKASDSLRKSNKALAGEIDALGRIRIKNLAATQATVKSLEGLARKYPQLTKQVGYLSTKVAAGNMPLATADKLLNQMRAGMGKAAGQASLFSRAMSSLVAHLKSFASYAAAASIISGVAAIFGLATRAVVKYDQALHDLQAITRATDDEVALMGEKIREIGRTTKFSASEVAVAMRTLGQAGFTASEAIASIGAVANLATGTLTNMKTVVDLVTTAIRAFDLKATETGRVADIFANAVNRSKLTIDKLRIAFNYIGPIAAKTGITLEETASTTMMLANAGIRASTIGTGLRRTFQQLIEPTKELQAAIAAAGYTTEDFNPQMNDMRDIIRRLTEIVPDAEAAFRMFSLRSSAAVAALSSQGVASFDALHSAVLRSGTAAEMAEKQIEGLGIIFKQAWDKAHDLALAFGEAGVSGALRILGKGLQMLFDGLRFLVESGIVEVIVKVGVLTAVFYGIGKAWAAIQVAQWAITLKLFVTQLGLAGAAVEGFGVALASLQKGIMPLLILSAALYGAYKLFAVLLSAEVKKVNTEYIDDLDEVHKKELERLESIKRLVSIVRDELETDAGRARALAELSKKTTGFNLVLEKETGVVEDLTGSILKHKDALDEASASFGEYNEKAKLEKLIAQTKLFEDAGDAIGALAPKMNRLKKQAGDLGEQAEKTGDQGKKSFLGWNLKMVFAAKRLKAIQKGAKALEAQQAEAHEKRVKAVVSFGEITQEVWKDYMLRAGATSEEVADLFTDSEEKITAAHVKAYLEIQLARKDMTDGEKKDLEEHIKSITGLFDKVNNITARRLERGLRGIREHYSEREKIITEFYDSDVLYMQKKTGFEAGAYKKVLGLVRRYSIERLALLDQQYEDEKALIENSTSDMADTQERITELKKKHANRRLKIEQEIAASITALAEEQLEILAETYERVATAYDESVDRRIDAITRCYDYEKTKIELQSRGARAALSDAAQYAERYVAIEADSSLRRIGIENEYVVKKKDAAASLFKFERDLAEKVAALEIQRFDELIALSEQAKDGRLANEGAYHKEQLELIESAQESVALQYEEGDEERIKKEKELNDKLVEIDRESTEKRLEILNAWADDLTDKYNEAIGNTRRYANRIIELENGIRDARKKASKAIVSATASTEDQVLRIRRAKMTETQKLWSTVREAERKLAQADHLAFQVGTEEALTRAKKLYGEAQSIYTDLGVKAAAAAKEGENIGISHKGAEELVVRAGQGIINVLNAEKEASVAAKQAELTVAEQSQRSWADLAGEIDDRVGDIKKDIAELAGGVGGLVSEVDSFEDKEVKVGANEEFLNTSIRLVGDLWTNISNLKNKEVVITTRYEEAHRAGGPIGKFARGGRLPGFGGGDKVRALLEAGEFVINKNSVRKYGAAMFAAYNSMSAPVFSAMAKPVKLAFGGFVGLKKSLDFTSGTSAPIGDISQIDKTITKLSKAIGALNQASASLALEGGLTKLKRGRSESREEFAIRKEFTEGAREPLDPREYELFLPLILRDLVGEFKTDLKGVRAEDQQVIEEVIALLTPSGVASEDIRARLSGRKLPEAGDVEDVVLELEERKVDLIQRKEELTEYLEDLKRIRVFMQEVGKLASQAAKLTATERPYSLGFNEPARDVEDQVRQIKEDFNLAKPILFKSGFNTSDIESAFLAYVEDQKNLAIYQVGNSVRSAHKAGRSGTRGEVVRRETITDIVSRLRGDSPPPCWVAWPLSVCDDLGESRGGPSAGKEEMGMLETVKKLKLQYTKQLAATQSRITAEKRTFLKSQVDKYQIQPDLSSEGESAKQKITYGPMEVPDSGSVQRAQESITEAAGKPEIVPAILVELRRKYRELAATYFAGLPKFAGGGLVDSILARLTPGEFVLRPEAVSQVGVPFLNALNNFKFPVPAFAGGGLVEPALAMPAANIPTTQTRDVHLQVNITGAGEITEKQVRKWIIPSITKITRLER